MFDGLKLRWKWNWILNATRQRYWAEGKSLKSDLFKFQMNFSVSSRVLVQSVDFFNPIKRIWVLISLTVCLLLLSSHSPFFAVALHYSREEKKGDQNHCVNKHHRCITQALKQINFICFLLPFCLPARQPSRERSNKTRNISCGLIWKMLTKLVVMLVAVVISLSLTLRYIKTTTT